MDELVGGPDDQSAQQIEGGVDEGGDEGEGGGREGGNDFGDEENDVCYYVDLRNDQSRDAQKAITVSVH